MRRGATAEAVPARAVADSVERRHGESGHAGRKDAQPLEAECALVVQVAGKVLIAAVAVESDGDVAARELGQVHGRYRGLVAERLAVVPDEPWQNGNRRRLDAELLVLGAEQFGDLPGVLGLIERGHIEADRERLHGTGGRLRHRRHHGARVDPAGEKGTERNVASKPQPRRLEELRADAFFHLLLGADESSGTIESCQYRLIFDRPSSQTSR